MNDSDLANDSVQDGQIDVEWEFADGTKGQTRVAGSLSAWELKQDLIRKLDEEEYEGLVVHFDGKEVYRWRIGMDIGYEVRPLEECSFAPRYFDGSDLE